jgi:magnesium transporter
MLDLAVGNPAGNILWPGVIACALYRDGQRVQNIAVEKVGEFAGRDGGIVWLGLHEPDAALMSTIEGQLGLHELMIEDANQAHQRAKLDIYDNVLFIVLRTAQLGSKGIQYGETHLIVGKGFVVSIRYGASASYAEVRQRCERNPDLLRLGESAIMYAILDFVAIITSRSSTRSLKNSKVSRRTYFRRCGHGKKLNAFIGCARVCSTCAMR